MKHLILVRHGESHGATPPQRDFDRTLTPAGEIQIQQLGTTLGEHHFVPEKIFTSSALRATKTADLLAQTLHVNKSQVIPEEKLYHTSPDELLTEIMTMNNDVERVMFVGHNPTISELATDLLRCEPMALSAGGACCLSFDVDRWEDLGAEKPEVKLVV